MGSQGQSGQAIKLFQITSYVNDFQTLNNLGYRQPVGASKKIVLPSIFHIVFHHWWSETCRVTQQRVLN